MALLSYDIRVVGLQAVNRALRSVERRVAALNRRQARGLGGTGAAGRRGGGSMATEMAAYRTMNQRRVVDEARTQRKLRAIRERGNRQRISDARRAARTEARIRAREERRGAGRGRGALRGQMMGRAGQSIRGGMRAVGAVGTGLLAIGGGFAIGGAINQEKRLQASAAALANQARGTEGGGGKSFTQLQSEAMKAARVEGIKSGQGPEAVVGMMRQFQAITGRFDIATQYADYMAEIGDATDAGLGDVGRTAGQIFQAINATGKDAQESIEATMKIMDAMAGQSKIGSIEMNDLAKEMGKLMSATANFKGDIGELAADMGAMAQTAIAGGASSAPEAMTALMRFADDLVKKGAASPIYKKLGIDVFEREMIGGKEVRAQLKSPVEVIKEIVGATKGDIAKIQGMFGIRAKKAVDPFARIYREAERKEAGTGIRAIEERFKKFRRVSLTEPQRKEAAAARREQADRQFDRAMQKFNDAVGRELLPVITRLIPKFVELIPILTKGAEYLGKFISWFAENPMQGIGAVILAAVAKDIAAAGIGAAIRNLFTGGGGGGGKGRGGGGIVPGIAAGFVLGDYINDIIDEKQAAIQRGRDESFERLAEVERMGGKHIVTHTASGEQNVMYRDKEGFLQEMPREEFERRMNPPLPAGGGGGGGAGAGFDPYAAGGRGRGTGGGGGGGGGAGTVPQIEFFDPSYVSPSAQFASQVTTAEDPVVQAAVRAALERVSAQPSGAGPTIANAQKEAAAKQLAAADKLSAAAEKLATAEPGRGPAPSPLAAK